MFWVADTLVTVAGAIVLRLVARRFVSPMAAASAGAPFFFFSPRWIYYSGLENLFYVPGIVLSLTAVWLLLRWLDHGERWAAWAMGFCAGLAIWCTPMTACLLLPPSIGFVWVARRRPVDLGRATVGLIVGVLPWLTVFASKGTKALHSLGTKQSHVTAFTEAVTKLIAVSLNLGSSLPAQAAIGWAVFVGSAVCLTLFLVQSRFELACCSASVVLWPFVVSALRVPIIAPAYRYAFLLAAPLLVIVCHLASLVRLSVIVALAVLVWVAHATYAQTNRFASAPVCNPALRVIGSYLISEGRTAVWGSYWAGGVLAVCQYPQLTVGISAGKGDASWARVAAATPKSTYVVTVGGAQDHEIRAWTHLHDPQTTRRVIGTYAVWLLPDSVPPTTMHLRGAF